MNYKLLISAMIFIFLFGCNGIKVEQGYMSFPESIKEKKIKIEATLLTDMEKGELTLKMNVQNNSTKTIFVDYLNCYLTAHPEIAVLPETDKSYKNQITPGDYETYQLKYNPVNSLEFFKRINYKGDLKKKYSLNLDFIKDNEGIKISEKNFSFELPDSAYQNYLSRFGKENKIHLFDYGFNFDTFSILQKDYCKKILPVRSSDNSRPTDSIIGNIILVSDSEIIIDNRVVGTQSYRQDDTLYMVIKLINMGTNKFKVVLNKFIVSANGKSLRPDGIQSEYFSYNQITDSTVILKAGGRFVSLLKYKLPEKFDQFELDMDWLLIEKGSNIKKDDDYINFFCRDLAFKELSKTVKN